MTILTTRRRSTTLIAAAVAAGALALAGCSSSSDSGGSSPTAAPTESPIGGGAAACDTATIEKAVEDAAAADGLELVNTKDYECADGWAIAFGITKSGDIEQTTAFVFQAEGQFWVPQDVGSLCQDDAAGWPASIKDQACALR